MVALKEIAVNLIYTNRRRSFPVLYAVKLFLVREIHSNLRSSSFFIASVVVYLSTRHSRQRHNKKKNPNIFLGLETKNELPYDYGKQILSPLSRTYISRIINYKTTRCGRVRVLLAVHHMSRPEYAILAGA